MGWVQTLRAQQPAVVRNLPTFQSRRDAAPASRVFAMRRAAGTRAAFSASAGILLRARAQHLRMLQARSMDAPGPGIWKPIGPFQVSTSSWNLVTGRVTAIAADPADASGNTVYVGTTGGGVWKSTDAAGTGADVVFAPLTDDLNAFTSAALTSLSIGAVSVQPNGSGVVLAGTGDPNDATDSWYGAGILRSVDGGATWDLISASAALAGSSDVAHDFSGTAFAGFAWSTVSPNLAVAAVSQSEYAARLGLSSRSSVLGLYFSRDAGATWQMATIEDGSTVVQSPQMPVLLGNAATAVVWNPVRQRFYAAVRLHGYYESSDGVTWTRLQHQPGVNLTTDLCPARPGLPGSMACPVFRGALAVQPKSGDLFAFTVDQSGRDQGIWQDACRQNSSGACASDTVQFGTRIADTQLEAGPGDVTINAGVYSLWLAAVPAQQDTLLFAGTADIWRCSLANGCSWRNTTNALACAASQVAPAQHGVDATFGDHGLLYFGNDGGLWRSTDAVAQQQPACSTDDAHHFDNLNAGLGSLAEVNGFSQDPDDSSTLLVALGGLGTAASSGASTVWNEVLDGEGDAVAIDPLDAENWYATSEFGVGINRCTQGTNCSVALFGDVVIGPQQVDNDVQTIPAPWLPDPVHPDQLILGTCRVWRGPASGVGWTQANLLSGMLDGNQVPSCNGNAEIRSLAAVPLGGDTPTTSGAERMYAGTAGVFDGGGLKPGHVFTAAVQDDSQANTTAWTDLYYSPVINGGAAGTQFNPGGFGISTIYADPHDASGQTVYVTVQGIAQSSSGQPLVYRSIDAGAHWSDITANLPGAPANGIVVDPNDPRIVYVALDTGVYVTNDVQGCSVAGAVCWNVFGSGLPNAPAMALATVSQSKTQLLRVSTYGRGLWETDLLTAQIAQTSLAVSPDALSFSGQRAQTVSLSQTVTVTNTGSVPLNITAVEMPSDFTESDDCVGRPVAPGSACQIAVAFAPSTTGLLEETMTVQANVSGGAATVALSGTGLPPAVVILTPSVLSFGSAAVGTSTAAQFITVANTGNVQTELTGESVSGDFAIISNSCGATLAAQTSCTIGITFTPAATGSRSGVLTVDDPGGSQIARLSGNGQSVPTDALSGLSLIFAAQQVGTVSAPQLITISNGGDLPLIGIGLSVTGDFTFVNGCGTLLQGHGTCSISVRYVPTVAGAESGQLTIADAIRTQTVALSGTGTAPPGISATPGSISFGGQGVGSISSTHLVTVTNNGGVTVTNISAAITSGFVIASNECSVTLRPGEACRLGITFSPAGAGPVTGTLSLSAPALPRALSVLLSGSGEDFTMGVTGSASAVVSSGQTASFTLQLAGISGTSGSVALACSGAPANSICLVNPASVAVGDANTSGATVTIATGVSASSALDPPFRRLPLLPLLAMVLPLSWRSMRRNRTALLPLLLALLVLVPAGCAVHASAGAPGGGSGSGSGGEPNPSPAGTYTITITGTMAGISHSTAVKLTVQ